MSLRRPGTRSRTLAAVGFLAAAGLFLTACGPDEDAAAGTDRSSSPSSPSSASSASSASSPTSASSSTSAPDDSASDAPAHSAGPTQAGSGKGVSGTFTGTLAYLAPGELLVGDQAFWVAEDTEITGAGICDAGTRKAESCTPDELDDAAEAGDLTVTVTIGKGIAERVTQA